MNDCVIASSQTVKQGVCCSFLYSWKLSLLHVDAAVLLIFACLVLSAHGSRRVGRQKHRRFDTLSVGFGFNITLIPPDIKQKLICSGVVDCGQCRRTGDFPLSIVRLMFSGAT